MKAREKIYSSRFERIIERAKKLRPHENDAAIGQLQSMMNEIRAEDFPLASLMESIDRSWDWNSKTLYNDGEINVGLFMVPKGHRIPLHDHPEMTVFFKALWGHMTLKAYDWDERYPLEGLAQLRVDTVLHGGSPTQLALPRWCNVHSIEALDDCAFVDLFSPPYSKAQGRICSNYQEKGWTLRAGEELMQLEAVS